MTDILDLPAVEFKLTRKHILRKIWSRHAKGRTAGDHLLFIACLAALSEEANRQACMEVKTKAAFTPITNKVKLANGAAPDQGLKAAQVDAKTYIKRARAFKEYPNYAPKEETNAAGRTKIDWLAWEIDDYKKRFGGQPFYQELTQFLTLEELLAAAVLIG
jgi:hypothetical protein